MREISAVDPADAIGKSWAEIRRQAKAYLEQDNPGAFERAVHWRTDPAWEVRAFALHVLGGLAARDPRALEFLYERSGEDPAWQVNEALAMAFDDHCAAVGYEQALPTIRSWLAADRPNLRRAVSEGLRPWTAKKRTCFAQRPELAIELLGTLRDDPSRYVQESVGNALRDISRTQPDLVVRTVQAWLAERPDSKPRQVIARHALRARGKG